RRVDRQPRACCRSSDGEADAGWADHRWRHTIPILRNACLRDSRNADRFRVPSRSDGAEAGNQRMADAGTSCKASNLSKRISRLDEEGWRTVLSLRRVERSDLRGVHSPGSRCMRGLFQSIWTDRHARPDDYPDRAATRLLLLVALRPALVASPIARDSSTSHWPGPGDYGVASSSVSLGRRRKELAPQADCGSDRAVDRDRARDLY